MNYYKDLLASAFAAITGNDRPNLIGLVASPEELGGAKQAGDKMDPASPIASWLPQSATVKSLEGGEAFVDESVRAVERSGASCVFAFPPLLRELRMTPEWRDRFGRLGLAEALAVSIMEPSGGNSGVEAMAILVPTHFLSSLRSSAWRKEFFPAHSAVVIEHQYDDVPTALGFPFPNAFQFTTVIFQRQPGPIRFF